MHFGFGNGVLQQTGVFKFEGDYMCLFRGDLELDHECFRFVLVVFVPCQ